MEERLRFVACLLDGQAMTGAGISAYPARPAARFSIVTNTMDWSPWAIGPGARCATPSKLRNL